MNNIQDEIDFVGEALASIDAMPPPTPQNVCRVVRVFLSARQNFSLGLCVSRHYGSVSPVLSPILPQRLRVKRC